MKKLLVYALAAFSIAGAGCSKEPLSMDHAGLEGGSYRLATLSATIEGEDADETRSSLQTSNNNVVYWTAKDRIRVVNTTTYESWIYELVSGAGTSVGKFEPLGAAATCEEDLSNIAAVYPAVAAIVDKSAKTLSFTVNHDWNKTEEGKERLTECNIRSWNNDSPTAFTHNDIKVSYHVNGSKENANFKFRQLGTWCVFAFDFTSDESIRKESLQSIEVTTTEGDMQISGTQRVDLTDPNQPVLVAKSTLAEEDKTVKWSFNSASGMSTAFTRSMMLFPGLENRQLKITAETNMHTFVFYAKPQVKLEAGTVLKFPIGFGQNFNTRIQDSDDPLKYAMAYTMTEKTLYPFYYYGDANCILIAGSKATATVDVTPHQASPYYEKKAAKATAAPKPAYAKVIWYETAMGAPKINGAGQTAPITGDSFSVTLADATKYGNALIGIYESAESETPLWSYHIWHPQDDPTLAVNPSNPKAMKLYENTYSGAYTVMPMALGATKVVVAEDTDAEKIKGAGLWYQWGRKDPLGRASAWNNNGTEPVTVLAGTLADDLSSGFSNSPTFFMQSGDGDKNRSKLKIEMFNAGYTDDELAIVLDKKEVEQMIDGKPVMVSADRHMINRATTNPTIIFSADGAFSGDWLGLMNNNLWGNPEGYNYPAMGTTYKSVFDPCPAGYRVAPKDLWTNFLVDINKVSDKYYFNVKGGGVNAGSFNKGWTFYYKGMGTVTLDERGDAIEYTEPKGTEGVDWATDFYPLVGFRSSSGGTLGNIGTGYYMWHTGANTGANLSVPHFTSRSVNLSAAGNKSAALNIRCVKEK